jgi:cytochrome b561
MGLRNSATRWGVTAQTLHWGMATLILGMFGLGWVAASWPLSKTKLQLFFWHKSIGMLLLALVALRALWRSLDPAPPLPSTMTRLEVWLAQASHLALYGLMAAIPLSGWVINSAANFPFQVFGLFPLPAVVEPSKATQQLAAAIHLGLFWALAALLTVHVAAALRHHFWLRDDILRRMLPTGRHGTRSPAPPEGPR